MYQVIKVLNNNGIIVKRKESNKEYIFLGKGIGFGRKIGDKAQRLLKAESAPSGKFKLIADPELTGVMIHEALGHATEADIILQNDNFLNSTNIYRVNIENYMVCVNFCKYFSKNIKVFRNYADIHYIY